VLKATLPRARKIEPVEAAMSYKTILVHLDGGEGSAKRLEVALGLAETFDAHLVGLLGLRHAYIPSFAIAEAGATIVSSVERRRAETARAAEAAFRAATARHDRSAAEWRISHLDALVATRLSARYADLVVVGQKDPGGEESSGAGADFAEELVLSAGRPVLLVPYAGRFAVVGRRILVAWNAGREAARAVTDALPLLTRADAVHVVAFNPDKGGADHGDTPGADIGLYLARHGVKVSVAQQQNEELAVGEQILSRAADLSVDLIVMGAYGHSRVRELMLGGATRTLLDSMTVPVLMSH
jgi:nucleotide-binding universal stress UspA family protein